MNRTIQLLFAAAAALGAGFAAAALPSCGAPVNCNYTALDVPDLTIFLGLGDTTYIKGTTESDCPDRIRRGVTFSTTNTSIINLTAQSDTSARIIAVGQGTATIAIASKDRSSLKRPVSVEVGAPNPDVVAGRKGR